MLANAYLSPLTMAIRVRVSSPPASFFLGGIVVPVLLIVQRQQPRGVVMNQI